MRIRVGVFKAAHCRRLTNKGQRKQALLLAPRHRQIIPSPPGSWRSLFALVVTIGPSARLAKVPLIAAAGCC